jgi:antitoxin ParD1/3/4
MTIHVPVDIEETIRQKVETGRYQDATEVIRAALRLLDAYDRRVETLRASIAAGLAAIERGDGIELTPNLMDAIAQEASERARLGRQTKPDVCP